MSITTKTSLDDINEYDFADVSPKTTQKQEIKVDTVAQEIIVPQSSQKKTPPPLQDKNIVSTTTSSSTLNNSSPTFSPMSIDTENMSRNTTQPASPTSTSSDDASYLSLACRCLANCIPRTLSQNRTYTGKY